jgi:hypothetical protein
MKFLLDAHASGGGIVIMEEHRATKAITLRIPLTLLESLDKLVALHPRYSRSCAGLAVLARGLDGITEDTFDAFVRRVMEQV